MIKTIQTKKKNELRNKDFIQIFFIPTQMLLQTKMLRTNNIFA